MTTCLIQMKTVKYRTKLDLTRTIETLLNELFIFDDQDTNEVTTQQYTNENNILLH